MNKEEYRIFVAPGELLVNRQGFGWGTYDYHEALKEEEENALNTKFLEEDIEGYLELMNPECYIGKDFVDKFIEVFGMKVEE